MSDVACRSSERLVYINNHGYDLKKKKKEEEIVGYLCCLSILCWKVSVQNQRQSCPIALCLNSFLVAREKTAWRKQMKDGAEESLWKSTYAYSINQWPNLSLPLFDETQSDLMLLTLLPLCSMLFFFLSFFFFNFTLHFWCVITCGEQGSWRGGLGKSIRYDQTGITLTLCFVLKS